MTRTVRRTAAPLVVAFPSVLALLSACAGGSAPDGSAPSPLAVALRVEPRPVPAGGTMHAVLEVTNRADTAVSLEFPTGQRFDFAIRRDGEEVVRWSSDRAFTQVLGTEAFPAGGSRTWEADMDAPLEAGEYTAVAWLTAPETVVQDSIPVTVR